MATCRRTADTVHDMRVLVTNDDGIDSVGLHVLARAMRPFGEVTIVAPDSEYSGASAAIGALHLMDPQIERREIEGIDESWSVTGAPALCVMFARLNVFGDPFDLVVSGINPGANVGRSVYHSGTVGAAMTARSGGVHGIAVSQAVDNWGVEGQNWDSMIENQKWNTAAEVTAIALAGFLSDPPDDPSVLNINVPNLALEDLNGWRMTEVAEVPTRTMTMPELTPVDGTHRRFDVSLKWGDKTDLPATTDTGAVERGEVSVTWLSPISAATPANHIATEAALTAKLGTQSS